MAHSLFAFLSGLADNAPFAKVNEFLDFTPSVTPSASFHPYTLCGRIPPSRRFKLCWLVWIPLLRYEEDILMVVAEHGLLELVFGFDVQKRFASRSSQSSFPSSDVRKEL
jgi:hypothetical protein